MNDLDLLQLAATGQLLARVDDTDYLAVHIVLARHDAGVPAIYCTYADWPGTLVARLAEREREIVELAAGLECYAAEVVTQARRAEAALARVAELEAQLAELPAAELAEDTAPAPMEPDDGKVLCDHPGCGQRIHPRGLGSHKKRAHGIDGPIGHKSSGKVAPAIQLVEDNPSWRCAEPGCAGAFTRSLSNPAYCTQHAKHDASTNGQMVAA
jgi:hypothetical protein